MSVDPSLKLKGALVRHRNVLTRDERIAKLKEEERWEEGDSLFDLPKVSHRKVSVGKKKETKAEAAEGAVAEAGAAPAAAGAPAAGKAGAPAKAAAPAAKAAPVKAAPAAKSTGQGKPGGGGGRR